MLKFNLFLFSFIFIKNLTVQPAAHYLGYLTSQLVWLHCEVLFCLGEHFRAFLIVLSTLWSAGSVLLPLIDCRLPSDLSLGLWPLYPISLPALTLCLVMFTYVRLLPRSWNCLTILILSVSLYSSGFALCCDWNFSCLINKLQMDSSASSDSLQAGRWSVCGTAEVVWKPSFLWQWPSAHLHFLVSCFSFSSWQYPIDCL